MDLDYLAKLVGGVREGEIILVGGGRSQGKSYFQDVFVDGESFTPNEIDWIVFDDWLDHLKSNDLINCVLMKSKSKQSRYIRVWRNK